MRISDWSSDVCSSDLPTLPTATDPHTVSTVGVFNDRSALTDSTLFEPLGLSYTTAPLASDVVSAGPASLELLLSTSVPGTDIYAVVSDVWPDGSAHPVATGRLRTTYPRIDEARSQIGRASCRERVCQYV